MEDYKNIKLDYRNYCGFYIDTGTLCPLMIEDLKQNEGHSAFHSYNFNVSICIHICDYFRKVNIPEEVEMD